MKESRLYSFLDNKNGFNVHFLEGKKLIADLTKIHNIGPNALDFYKNTVLTSSQMVTFLKPGETLGFYIDSEQPYFRFKIEMNHIGTLRTLLLPEEFKEFPEKLSGIARTTKAFPNKTPYSSSIPMEESPVENVINTVLEQSYQTNSLIEISDTHDQSLMFTKLPALNVNKEIDSSEDIQLVDFILKHSKFVTDMFAGHVDDLETIVKSFEEKGFAYLGSKEIKFFCPCSKERMTYNLVSLQQNDLEHIFGEKDSVEIRCDYCNTIHHISKSDIDEEMKRRK